MSLPYRRIAVCVDDSDASMDALAQAVRLHEPGAEALQIVHVVPWPPVSLGATAGAWIPDPEPAIAAARSWLESVTKGIGRAEPVLLLGHPPAAVCDWAERANPDLIVAAAHRGLVERALLGSFSAHVARHAPCHVLLVRPSLGSEGTITGATEAATPRAQPTPAG